MVFTPALSWCIDSGSMRVKIECDATSGASIDSGMESV
jgi:hypothetical protein